MDWMNGYLKGLKEYARDYVLENTSLKVLALLITGVLWLSVASRPVSQVAIRTSRPTGTSSRPRRSPCSDQREEALEGLAGPGEVVGF